MKRRVLIPLLAIALIAMGLLVAWGVPSKQNPQPGDPDGRVSTVVATTGMIADVAREVAGDRASVVQLVGSGVDPHLYKPTRGDVRRLLDGDLILYNGLHLEGKMTDALERAKASGVRVHAVTERLAESELLSPDSFDGHPDPHVWMDPSVWLRTVDVIRDALSELDPEGSYGYQERAAAYADRLRSLDEQASAALATVPESARVLVTAHDAFGYFGRRYGYEVLGIQGISTESEAGVFDIERLVDLLVEREIGAVFIESTVPERNIEALIAGAKARGSDVKIGGELFSDAMGPAGGYTGTYLGMIDHNVTSIVRALGGDVPEQGLNGRLTP